MTLSAYKSSRRRYPLESTDQSGDRELSWADVIGSEQSDEQMLEWSFSMSMMIVAHRVGTERNVAWRDDASCSCVNIRQRLCRFMLAWSLPPSLGYTSHCLISASGLVPRQLGQK